LRTCLALIATASARCSAAGLADDPADEPGADLGLAGGVHHRREFAFVTDVYDRHGYADEDRRIIAAVARHVSSIVEGTKTSNVVSLR
jgi:hypothetical protein